MLGNPWAHLSLWGSWRRSPAWYIREGFVVLPHQYSNGCYSFLIVFIFYKYHGSKNEGKHP